MIMVELVYRMVNLIREQKVEQSIPGELTLM